MRELPRELNLGWVVDHRGVEHQVIEQKSKDTGVRYVMAQDSETAKERDKYKLRSHLLQTQLDAANALLSKIKAIHDNPDNDEIDRDVGVSKLLQPPAEKDYVDVKTEGGTTRVVLLGDG